jgi:hypothetical protein
MMVPIVTAVTSQLSDVKFARETGMCSLCSEIAQNAMAPAGFVRGTASTGTNSAVKSLCIGTTAACRVAASLAGSASDWPRLLH